MIVHINSHIIRENCSRNKEDLIPPISIRSSRSGAVLLRTNEVHCKGNVRVVYDPHRPLKCGARVWIECDAVKDIGGTDAGAMRYLNEAHD